MLVPGWAACLQVGAASYVWLPLLPQADGSYQLQYYSSWSPADFQHLLQAPADVQVPVRVHDVEL